MWNGVSDFFYFLFSNLHTVKFTCLGMQFQDLWQTVLYNQSRTTPSPQNQSLFLPFCSQTLHPTFNPWQPLMFFPSLKILPFLECQCVTFWVWLLSLSMTHLTFMHVNVVSTNGSLYCWVVVYCWDVPHFIYPFISWRTFEFFPILSNYQ